MAIVRRGIAVYWSAAALGVCLLAPLAPQFAALMPACLFHSITGLPCPSCGSTRAAMALSHLDLASAFGMNPLAALAAVAFVFGGLAAGIAALIGRPLRFYSPSERTIRLLVILAVTANWGWLLLRDR